MRCENMASVSNGWNVIILMAIGINFGRIWAYLMEERYSPAVSAILIAFLLILPAIIISRWWYGIKIFHQSVPVLTA
jgi:hypothetical protein